MTTVTSNTFSVTVQAEAWDYVGIPYPTETTTELTALGYTAWPYDPCTVAIPDQPANWPSAEQAGYYYINKDHASSTDTANTYGYPDKPRNTLPSGTYAAGTYVEWHGSGYTFPAGNQIILTMNGTAGNQCFITGTANFSGTLRFDNSEHVIVDGITWGWTATGEKTGIDLREGDTFITIRNNTFTGDGTAGAGGGGAFGISGGAGNDNTHIMCYKNTITGFGDATQVTQNDKAGFTATLALQWAWVIDNTVTSVGGDSIIVGSVTAGANRPVGVFIAGNNFGSNGENPIDVKDTSDVIISQNILHDGTAPNNSDDPGSIMPVHDDAKHTYIIFNEIYTAALGMNCTGGSNCWIVGNEFTGMDRSIKSSDSGSGYCANFRGGHSGGFIDNTVYACDGGVSVEVNGGAVDIQGNIFADKTASPLYDVFFGNSTVENNAVLDYNLYESISCSVDPTVYSTLGDWQAITTETNSKTGNPDFTAEGSRDYTLGASSAALDSNTKHHIYTDFNTRYGISIENDINGTTRPVGAGDWDIGANERT